MIDYGFIRKVSVDHERAGLRADRDHSFRLRGLSCQSIMSALACALVTTQSKTSGFKVCQSIMSALACALVVFSTRPLPVSIVSVDHERAGLRAIIVDDGREAAEKCQSIMSALACALAIVEYLQAIATVCQSIMSALACALDPMDFIVAHMILCQSIMSALACALAKVSGLPLASLVSVDHERAGLRARSSRLRPLLQGACQSIMSALACALALRIRTGTTQAVSVDHERAGLRALGAVDSRRRAGEVSVDHERAGLRASQDCPEP